MGGGSESGLFALAAVYGRAVSTNNTVPVLADVDGDHVVDLLAAPFPLIERSPGAQDSISVWKGRGDGTFASGAIVTTFTEPSQFEGVSIADFDGDGRADADISTASSQTYAFGQSDGTFVMGASWGGPASNLHNCGVGPFAGPGSWGTFYAGLDSGGAIDYSVATVKGLPNSSVNYAGPTSLDVSVGANGYVQCLGWGDVAGDGKLEYGLLAVGGAFANETSPIEVLSWTGTAGVQPTMTEITVPPLAANDYIASAQMADLDGDGLADFAVGLGSGTCGFLWNDGGGTFTRAAGIAYPCEVESVGDFNGDRIPDILVWDPSTSYIVFGDGARGFGRQLDLPSSLVCCKTSSLPFWAVDVNNDGVLDLVFIEQATTSTGEPVEVTYVYISTARTPAPAQPDIQCDALSLEGGVNACTPPARI